MPYKLLHNGLLLCLEERNDQIPALAPMNPGTPEVVEISFQGPDGKASTTVIGTWGMRRLLFVFKNVSAVGNTSNLTFKVLHGASASDPDLWENAGTVSGLKVGDWDVVELKENAWPFHTVTVEEVDGTGDGLAYCIMFGNEN